MLPAVIIWDLDDDPRGNVQHLAVHGVTKEETEIILGNLKNPTVQSRTSGENITFGWTLGQRYLAVVWSHVHDDPLTIYPITAYEVKPPRSPRQRKRRK